MAYYLSKERETGVVGAYRRYKDYLAANREKYPPNAFALATAAWYYDPSDHRCPHDAWLENLIVSESIDSDGRRFTNLRVVLLGAYHDGHIEFAYPRVLEYSVQALSSHGLGDWRYDEFRVNETGQVIHEIEWAGFPGEAGARWIITASDVEFRWRPTSANQ